MGHKERNIIIGVISSITSIMLLMFLIPFLPFTFLRFDPTEPLTYLFLDIVALIITLNIYAIFMIKPTRSPKGKKNLGITIMILGIILILIPLLGISIQIFWFFVGYFSLVYLTILIPFIGLLIPGLAFNIHGWFLIQKARTEI